MVKLLIILLITNIFTSCGKKQNESGERSNFDEQEQKEPKEQIPKEEKVIQISKILDDDGDTIPNDSDESPFVANTVYLDQSLSVTINGQSLELKHHSLGNNHIMESIRKNPISSSRELNHSTGDYYIKIPKNINNNFVLNINVKLADQLTLEISNGKVILNDSIILNKNRTSLNYSKNLFPNNRIYFSSKKFRNTIKQKTYQLIISEKQITKRFNISTKLNLESALKELKLNHIRDEFHKSQSILKHKEFIDLTNQFQVWTLFNTTKQDLNSSISAGKSIFLIAFNKKMLAIRKVFPPTAVVFDKRTSQYIINLKNLTEFRLNITGKHTEFLTSKTPKYEDSSVSGITFRCKYEEIGFYNRTINLDPSKLFNYYLNGSQYNYDELKHLTVEGVGLFNLAIKPKPEIEKALDVGFSALNHICPGIPKIADKLGLKKVNVADIFKANIHFVYKHL